MKKLTIEELRNIAKKRNGKCLSSTYVYCNKKLLWECSEGHQWNATPRNVKKGSWCADCSTGLGERICREFFEQFFGKSFPRSYPRWLVNKRGNQMELDGHCQSLSLAFEHHGEQHYSTRGKLFIKSEKGLQERQEDDRVKRELCKQHKITLIEIPEIPTLLSVEKIKSFIKKECKLNGVSLPSNYDTKIIDINKAYATPILKTALREMRSIAEERGGKCLSNVYSHSKIKLLWECSEKHQWEATPNSIKRGRWCPYCAGSLKRTIEEMQIVAEERGGKCLSDSYVNSNTNLLWECAEGHQWEAVPSDVKRRTWCPECANINKKAKKH